MKIMKKILPLILLVLLVGAVFAGCNEEPVAVSQQDPLRISAVPVIPYAYINEQFDLREVIVIEDGVEYSATAYFVKMTVDSQTKEYSYQVTDLPVENLCFTPIEVEESVIKVSAKRGSETTSKVIYIPTTVRAEPLDGLFSSSGKLGGADPGVNKNVNIDPMFLKGEGSTTSLHVSFNSVDMHAYGNRFLEMHGEAAQEYFTDQTWENAIVTFWVYNPNELPIEFQFYIVDKSTGFTRDWNAADGPHKQRAEPGQWTQCFFSLRKLGVTRRLTNTKYVSDILRMKFRYDGFNTEESYSMDFYIDGLDVVPASMYPEIDTKYIVSNETLEQGWENMVMDTGWQGVYTEYDYEVIQGGDSTCSLKAYFNNEKALTNSFIAFSSQSDKRLKELPDMTGGKFSGYFKFENIDPRVSLDIVNSKWTMSNQVDFNLKSVGDGWYYGEVNLEEVQVGTGRNDNIIRIRLNFYGANENSIVYVDNCKFDYKHVEKVLEAVSVDWINMTPDTGDYYKVGKSEFNTSYLKGGNSVRSLKLTAPSDTSGKYTLNTEQAVKLGEISVVPNMNKGTLGAWFYFGNQTPKASFFMTNNRWKGSNWVDFVFVEDAGNGWYYGALNASSLVCEEGGGTSSAIRLCIVIPKGYTVYIDNLSWKPNDESLVKIVKNDEIVSTITNGTVQDETTNGSSAAWKVVPTLGTEHNWAYPKLTLDQSYPEGNYKLTVDVMPVNMEDFQINLSVIDGKWLSGVTSQHLPIGQWTTVSFDVKAAAISDFNMGFEIVGGQSDYAIYLDNFTLTPVEEEERAETVADDWIHMSVDAGMTNAVYSFTDEMVKAEDSITSLKLDTADAKIKFTISPQWELEEKKVDMTDGVLSAYFHFSDESAEKVYVAADLYASNWKHTDRLVFELESVGDGWYYGTLDTSKYDFSAADLAAGATKAEIIRIEFLFRQNIIVHVDGLKFEQKAVEEVVNDEIVTAVSNNAEGAVQAEVTNNSDAAWKVIPTLGTEHNWAYPQFVLDQEYAIDGHKLVMDVKPVNMEEFQINLALLNGQWLTGVVSQKIPTGEWTTVSFDLTGTSINSFHLGVEIVGGVADYAFYIDNVKLIPVEDEEKTETVADDWIHMAIDEGMTNAVYTFTNDMVKAEDSITSLKLDTADAKIKFTISPQWELEEKKVDMTSGILSGYFHFSDESAEKVYVAADLYAGNWKHTDRLVFELESVGDGWYYGILDTSKCDFTAADLEAGASKSDIIRIQLLFRQNIIVHVDGLRFEQKIINDEIVAEISNNAEGTVQAEVTNNSSTAWKVVPTLGTEHNWAYPQFVLDQEYDIDGHKLVMDVKPVNMESCQINLSVINGSWLSGVTSTFLTVDQWTTVSFDLTGSSISNFHLGMEVNGGENYAVYVDNIKLVRDETVAEDWIHMAIDEGMTNAVFSYTDELVKAEGSTSSVKLDTADAKIKFTISPEWELDAKKVDMTSGILSGYFHFSDESAEKVYVAADLYASNWKHTDRLVFELESVGDGWYYGTLDTSKFDFTAADLAAGATKAEIIRIQLLFRQNIIVHVDGLKFEDKADRNDMFAGGTQAGGSLWSAGNNLTYVSDCTEVYGENSISAWKFSAGAANANQWAQFLMGMTQSYNMDGYYLVFDAKVEGTESQTLSLRPRTGTDGAKDPCNNTVLQLTSGWNTYTVDFSAALKSGSTAADLGVVQRIFLVFDFAANTGSDRSIIIDNVRLVEK